MVLKPLESGCPSCEVVTSEMGSQYSGGSSGVSGKYSYAKSRSKSSMAMSFAKDERAKTPQEDRNVRDMTPQPPAAEPEQSTKVKCST